MRREARPLTGVRVPLAFERCASRRCPHPSLPRDPRVRPGEGRAREGAVRQHLPRLRATQLPHLRHRQRHLADRLVAAAGRGRLARLDADPFRDLARAGLARRFSAGAVFEPARRRTGRSARPGRHHPHHPADRLRAGDPAGDSRRDRSDHGRAVVHAGAAARDRQRDRATRAPGADPDPGRSRRRCPRRWRSTR